MSVKGTRKVQYGRKGSIKELNFYHHELDKPVRGGIWAVKSKCLELQTLTWAADKDLGSIT